MRPGSGGRLTARVLTAGAGARDGGGGEPADGGGRLRLLRAAVPRAPLSAVGRPGGDDRPGLLRRLPGPGRASPPARSRHGAPAQRSAPQATASTAHTCSPRPTSALCTWSSRFLTTYASAPSSSRPCFPGPVMPPDHERHRRGLDVAAQFRRDQLEELVRAQGQIEQAELDPASLGIFPPREPNDLPCLRAHRGGQPVTAAQFAGRDPVDVDRDGRAVVRRGEAEPGLPSRARPAG